MSNSDIKKVVGLKYTPGEALPRLILKGSGKIADEILKDRNTLNSSKVVMNKDLVNKLYRLPIDAEISQDVYEVVAIILAHIFSINQKLKESIDDGHIFSTSVDNVE